jgi:hypothetical protein
VPILNFVWVEIGSAITRRCWHDSAMERLRAWRKVGYLAVCLASGFVAVRIAVDAPNVAGFVLLAAGISLIGAGFALSRRDAIASRSERGVAYRARTLGHTVLFTIIGVGTWMMAVRAHGSVEQHVDLGKPVGPAADGAVALLALGGVSLSILGMIAVVWRVILLFGALAGHDHEPQNTAATQLSSLDIVNDIDWVDPSTPTKLDNQHTRTF